MGQQCPTRVERSRNGAFIRRSGKSVARKTLSLSAITWGGYDNFYYLFSHEDSRDSFAIPHDLRILKEVFTLDPGGYNASNAYWTSHNLVKMLASLDRGNRERLVQRIDDLTALYADLSAAYQAGKGSAGIPLP